MQIQSPVSFRGETLYVGVTMDAASEKVDTAFTNPRLTALTLEAVVRRRPAHSRGRPRALTHEYGCLFLHRAHERARSREECSQVYGAHGSLDSLAHALVAISTDELVRFELQIKAAGLLASLCTPRVQSSSALQAKDG